METYITISQLTDSGLFNLISFSFDKGGRTPHKTEAQKITYYMDEKATKTEHYSLKDAISEILDSGECTDPNAQTALETFFRALENGENWAKALQQQDYIISTSLTEGFVMANPYLIP